MKCENIIKLHCDCNRNIISCSNSDLLGYDTLVNKNLNILMTPIISKIHYCFYYKLNTNDLNELRDKMRSTMHSPREYVIISYYGEYLYGDLDVELLDNYESIITIKLIDNINSPLVPKKYLQFINNKPEFHVDKYQNCICIMCDMANSTEYACGNDSIRVARIYHDIYNIALHIIMKEYYPYTYIHETCGDNFFILINTEFMCKCEYFAATIALNLCKSLIPRVNEYLARISDTLYLRCGIAMGDISAGVIDGKTFRVFGDTVHLASRLENISGKNKISFNDKFHEKVMEEMELEDVEQSYKNLKGFGLTLYYQVNCNFTSFCKVSKEHSRYKLFCNNNEDNNLEY